MGSRTLSLWPICCLAWGTECLIQFTLGPAHHEGDWHNQAMVPAEGALAIRCFEQVLPLPSAPPRGLLPGRRQPGRQQGPPQPPPRSD